MIYRRLTPNRIFGKLIDTLRKFRARFLKRRGVAVFLCPLCGFEGEFLATRKLPRRRHAICPKCGALERHRIQALALRKLSGEQSLGDRACLQFAPDPVTPILREICKSVVTADLNPKPGSRKLDITDIDLENGSVDMVFASHVLEHVPADRKALSEIARILRPGGIAVLPVPITSASTIEYDAPRADEDFHVRAPGLDYFEKYRAVFGHVETLTSNQFSDRHQTWIIDDKMDLRYEEVVPVCYKIS